MKYIDVHAHISSFSGSYDSIGSLLKTCKEEGINKIIDTAIDLKTSKCVLDNFVKHSDILIPVCGLHPEILIPGSDIYNLNFDIDKEFKEFSKFFDNNNKNIKAIGECGLDYYWLDRNKELDKSQKDEIKQKQVKLFKKLIVLSNNNNLPLVIHSRGAEKECFSIVNEQLSINNKIPDFKYPIPKVLFHCFTGDIHLAEEILNAGYYISFNGILTYKSGDNIRKILKLAWKKYREQILVETDAPFLAPIQVKDHICKPYYIKYAIQVISKAVNIEEGIVSEKLNSNAERFYKI